MERKLLTFTVDGGVSLRVPDIQLILALSEARDSEVERIGSSEFSVVHDADLGAFLVAVPIRVGRRIRIFLRPRDVDVWV